MFPKLVNTDETCSSVFPNEKPGAEVDRTRMVSAYSSQLGQGWCLWRQRQEEGVSEEGKGPSVLSMQMYQGLGR